jgi:hypothetical protein
VNWIDIYDFDTEGQIIDVTDLADGVYLLRSTVDPDDQLRETDDQNNAGQTYVEITGNRARGLDAEEAIERLKPTATPTPQ